MMRRSAGNAPTLFVLAGRLGTTEAEISAALTGLAMAGKLDVAFPRHAAPPVINIRGARWLAPNEAAPVQSPASALKIDGNGGVYTPPNTLDAAQRACAHFYKASLMHLGEIERLEGILARFGSENQTIRKLKLDNRALRDENQRLRQQARTATGAWLGYARKFQAMEMLPQ
jgi:hypothetical protein